MISLKLYFITFLIACLLTYVVTHVCRYIALRFKILDIPHSVIKTHKIPTPYLGGLGVAIGFMLSMLYVRLTTQFPDGTLHSLRGIFLGSVFMLILGLVDDIKPKGLHYREKFLLQIVGAMCLLLFGVQLNFIQPSWMGWGLSLLWIVGVSNSLNIIDIMDGLCSSVASIAALGFLFISFPSEQIYVNIAACALAGSLAGFLPHNLSSKRKIFLGDTGSLFIGFLLAALSMGASYTKVSILGLFAPLFILIIPLFDTLFVSCLRIQQGISPFMGSKDHFALRLEKWKLRRPQIVWVCIGVGLIGAGIAQQMTVLSLGYGIALLTTSFIVIYMLAMWLSTIDMRS